jgi:hypothetical protein
VRCPRCRELIVLAKAEESVVAKPPGEEVVAAAQSVDTQDWRPAVDEILSLMQKSSDRRDELLGLIDNKLFAISFCVFLWTIALVLGGCVFIVKQ